MKSRVQQTTASLGRFVVPHTIIETISLGQAGRGFCKANKLKKGDVCTFNVIKTLLWHVDISRCKQNKNSVPYIFELLKNGLNVKLSSFYLSSINIFNYFLY